MQELELFLGQGPVWMDLLSRVTGTPGSPTTPKDKSTNFLGEGRVMWNKEDPAAGVEGALYTLTHLDGNPQHLYFSFVSHSKGVDYRGECGLLIWLGFPTLVLLFYVLVFKISISLKVKSHRPKKLMCS